MEKQDECVPVYSPGEACMERIFSTWFPSHYLSLTTVLSPLWESSSGPLRFTFVLCIRLSARSQPACPVLSVISWPAYRLPEFHCCPVAGHCPTWATSERGADGWAQTIRDNLTQSSHCTAAMGAADFLFTFRTLLSRSNKVLKTRPLWLKSFNPSLS